MALSWSMDKVGILARTAQDCGTVFGLIGGEDEEDGMSVDAPFRPAWTRVLERARGLTIAVVPEDYERWGDADVHSGRDAIAEILRGAGAEIRTAALPDHPWEAVASTIIAVEQASAFEEFVQTGGVSSIIDAERRGELLGGGRIPAVDYLRCQRLRRRMQEDLPALFGGADLLLGSATLRTAPPVEADLSTIFAGGNVIEAAENLLGLPGVAFPCGVDRNGLPVGAKLIGRPFADDLVLEAVHLVQTLTTWHTRHPQF
jgi:aspartyl-tRNA(Asn)/glutamyl-tRNA(Gln) amidotransferase subunit A